MSQLIDRESFHRARSRAIRRDILARLGGRPKDLLPFETLAEALKVHQQIERVKPEMIPLDKIVGSVGRYRDFTRDFLPRHSALADRWLAVENAMESPGGVPPIEVYKIGDVYFVADGNHRVSVARANGFDAIEAYVTEIPIDAGLTPGDSLDQAILKAERARFLAETRLDDHVTPMDIFFTQPGGFPLLLRHVQVHQELMSEKEGPVSLQAAAVDWYEKRYLPIVKAIRERRLLQKYPGRTAADLYVWIWSYIRDACRRTGEHVDPVEAAALLKSQAAGLFGQAVQGLVGTLGEISRTLAVSRDETPDWASPTLEWDDGTLSELYGETSQEDGNG